MPLRSPSSRMIAQSLVDSSLGLSVITLLVGHEAQVVQRIGNPASIPDLPHDREALLVQTFGKEVVAARVRHDCQVI